MPDPTRELAQLPIVRELGVDLRAAYGRHEHAPVRRRRRRALVIAGALSAAAAVAFALVSGLDRGHVSPAPASAAQALAWAASAAESGPAPFPRDDQFFYVHSRATNLVTQASAAESGQSPAALVTKDRRIWTSVRRMGRLRERVIKTTFPVPADRREWTRQGMSSPGLPADGIRIPPSKRYHLGDSALTRRQLLAYPPNPATIYDRLRARVGDRGHSPDGEVFTELGDALRETPSPAPLRAALYRALALVPGVQLVGTVSDSVGRTGTAVAFTETGVRAELIFDPRTSQMLAERRVVLDPRVAQLNVPAGTVIEDTTYLQRAVTEGHG